MIDPIERIASSYSRSQSFYNDFCRRSRSRIRNCSRHDFEKSTIDFLLLGGIAELLVETCQSKDLNTETSFFAFVGPFVCLQR